MRVNSIIPNQYMHKAILKNNHNNDYSYYRTPVIDQFTPSFQAKINYPIKTQRDLKKHAIKTRKPCMYCNLPLSYDDSAYEKWKQANLFNSPIKDITKTLKPYKNSLHPTERAVFSFIEIVEKKYPNIKLNDAIQIISQKANKKLLKAQMPIFDELMLTSKELPVDIQYKLFELIQKSRFRMEKKPYIEEFSGKEFHYKIKKLAKTIPNDILAERITKLSELLTIPGLRKDSLIEEQVIKRIFKTINSNNKSPQEINIKNPKITNNYIKDKIIK